ncbi:hypothetical protein V2J09_016649 [Rumex salicifolius]
MPKKKQSNTTSILLSVDEIVSDKLEENAHTQRVLMVEKTQKYAEMGFEDFEPIFGESSTWEAVRSTIQLDDMVPSLPADGVSRWGSYGKHITQNFSSIQGYTMFFSERTTALLSNDKNDLSREGKQQDAAERKPTKVSKRVVPAHRRSMKM